MAEDNQTFGQLIDPLRFAAARDPEGQDWIAGLPGLVDLVCRQWGLDRDSGPIRHGYGAVVIPVQRGSESFVLKLAWPPQGMVVEARGLEVWDGRGMVRMAAADAGVGALLLERLDADRPLRSPPAMDAARVAGRLLRRLAIPAPPGFRDARTLVAGTARSLEAERGRPDCPVPVDWIETALHHAHHLAKSAGTDRLIHADLHYDNILAGTREPWLAVDPRPVAGEPEQAVPELLWTCVDDPDDNRGIRQILAVLIESAGLDAERTRQWIVVRCVDYWMWGSEHGLTRDPERCRGILQSVLREDRHVPAGFVGP